ncbi:MAG: hypothetical protein RL459_1725 [Pseudomonadota bacterium]|jgi:putative tricarboxylic transport membrane protein
MQQHAPPATSSFLQTLVALGVILVALGLALGAFSIPADSGYAGVGPNFLPWVVSACLLLCGVVMFYQARHGGFAHMDEVSEDQPYWPGFVWMSAGLLLNAALITTLGFILSCTLCFVMAARGLRNAAGHAEAGLQSWVTDLVTGLLIAAPVYWMFTQFLGINLPGLTQSGWL